MEAPSPVDLWRNFTPSAVLQHGFMAQNHQGRWYVRVWADEDIRDDCGAKLHAKAPADSKIPCSYLLLLSIRDSRRAAMKDADKWMNEAAKKIDAEIRAKH